MKVISCTFLEIILCLILKTFLEVYPTVLVLCNILILKLKFIPKLQLLCLL